MLRRPTRGNGSLPTAYGGGGIDGMSSPEGGGGYGGYGGGSNGAGGGDGSYGGYSGGGPTGSAYGGYGNAGGGGGSSSGSAYGGYGSSSGGFGGFGASPSGDFKDKIGRKNRNSPVELILSKLKEPWTWSIITTIFFMILTLNYRSKFNSILKVMDIRSGGVKEAQLAWDGIIRSRDSKNRQVTSMQEQQRKINQKHTECEQAKRQIMKERDELRVKYESPDKKQEISRNLSRDKALKQQLQLLQNATQRESRRTAMER